MSCVVEHRPAGRVAVTPTPEMISHAKSVTAKRAKMAVRFEHEKRNADSAGLVAEACWSVALGRLGVEHRWLDGETLPYDVVLADGRRVDVKCTWISGVWHESYQVPMPVYIVTRRKCDLVAYTAYEKASGRYVLLGMLGVAAVAVLEQRGAARRVGEGQPLHSGKPATYPMFEIQGRAVPPVRRQAAALAKVSYVRERDSEWWLRLWPGLEGT